MKKNFFLVLAMALPLLTFVACDDGEEGKNLLNIDYTDTNVDGAGGTATFTVKSNLSWTVINDDAWITGITPENGKGTQSVTVTFAANTSANPRNSTFRVMVSEDLDKKVTITQNGASASTLLFTDIPAGSYKGTGVPKLIDTPGPTSWSGSVIPNEADQFYTIQGWAGGTANRFYIDYYQGKLYIDNIFLLVQDTESDGGPYYGYFEASYVIGNTIYILDDYSPAFNKTTKTIDFSGTYEGAPVWVGILAYTGTDHTGFNGGFGDSYENCRLVITPARSSAAQMGGSAPMDSSSGSFSGKPVSLDGLTYGGRVKLDPAKFSRN